MTTETILTDERLIEMAADVLQEHFDRLPNSIFLQLACAIEQAVLQSPEVQALIGAAQEFSDLYGWLWDTTEEGGFLSPEGVRRYDDAHHKLQVALCGITGRPLPIDLDEIVDSAKEQQK